MRYSRTSTSLGCQTPGSAPFLLTPNIKVIPEFDICESAGRFFLLEPQGRQPVAQGKGGNDPLAPPWVTIRTICSLSPTRPLCWGEGEGERARRTSLHG